MKVSTSLLFDRATERMTALQNRLATTQAQMTESKKILSPSDSPDAAAAIQRLRGEIERQGEHAATLKATQQRYSAEETAMASANDIVIRLKELAVQAANDSNTATDRKLLGVGNSKDDSGNYLFSGTRVNTPAFAEDAFGKVTYQGDQTQTRIPAGVQRTVSYTRSGSDVFSRVVREDGQGNSTSVAFFDALDQMIDSVDNNQASGIHQGLADLEQMHDQVTLSLAATGDDQKLVQAQLDVLDQTQLRLKTSLSEIEDLDYTEAVTRMQKEVTALQAAMGSFSKMSNLSLFEYIR
jgi:flagellar hook-associated protein 3 FlgL